MVRFSGNAAVRPAPLRAVSPASIASAAVAIGAAVASDCLLEPFFERSALVRGLGAGMATVFGVAGTRWALARPPSAFSALRGSALSGAVVLAWFTLCDRIASLHRAGSADGLSLLMLPLLLVVVAAIGATVGTLFGLTAVPVVRRAERARARETMDAAERVLFPAAVWLGAWGLAFVVLHHPRSLAPLGQVVLALGGLVCVIVRDARRLRFLSAVARGEEPLWHVERASPSVIGSLPAYGPHRAAELDGQLVHGSRTGGPYRAGPAPSPTARIPLERKVARRPFVRRIAVATLVATGLFVVTVMELETACLRW